MKNYTFLVFLFVISMGILFIGSGVTGLTSLNVNLLEQCTSKGDCSSGKICCGFQEGDQVYRICAEDCRYVNGFSQEPGELKGGFLLDITGESVRNVKSGSDYWVYILIGVVLVLLALFYKKAPKKVVEKKAVKSEKKHRKR